MLWHTLLKLSLLVLVLAYGTDGCHSRVNVDCSSWRFKPRRCRIPGGGLKMFDITLIKQYSRSRCQYGRTYGLVSNYIWVKKGCRARFNVCRCQKYKVLRCNSMRFRYRACPVPSYVSAVFLRRKFSRSACTKWKSYGYSLKSVWVDKGCRALFDVCY